MFIRKAASGGCFIEDFHIVLFFLFNSFFLRIFATEDKTENSE